MIDPLQQARQIWIRRVFLTVITASCVVLVPWVVFLAVELPRNYLATHWRAAWVGFDVALTTMLALTAWMAWTRRQLMLPCALISATLLVCDAWFDCVLAWGTSGIWYSLASAVFAELPLAALLVFVATRMIRVLMSALRWDGRPPGSRPSLFHARLTDLVRVSDQNRASTR